MDQWSYEFFEAWMDRTLSSTHEHESDISSRRGPEIVRASVARMVCDGEVLESKLYVAAAGPTFFSCTHFRCSTLLNDESTGKLAQMHLHIVLSTNDTFHKNITAVRTARSGFVTKRNRWVFIEPYVKVGRTAQNPSATASKHCSRRVRI